MIETNKTQANIPLEQTPLIENMALSENPNQQLLATTEFIGPDNLISHTLEDGREFEGTFEEAQKLCPFLGKMSTEEAMKVVQESNIAVMLAEKGKALRLAREERDVQKPEPLKKEEPKDTKVANVIVESSTINPQQSQELINLNHTIITASKTSFASKVIPEEGISQKIHTLDQPSKTKKDYNQQPKNTRSTSLGAETTKMKSKTKPKIVVDKKILKQPQAEPLTPLTNNTTDTIPRPYRLHKNNVTSPLKIARGPAKEEQSSQDHLKMEGYPNIETLVPPETTQIHIEFTSGVSQFDTETHADDGGIIEESSTTNSEKQEVIQTSDSEAEDIYSDIAGLIKVPKSTVISKGITSNSEEMASFNPMESETDENIVFAKELANPLQTLIEQYPQPKRQITLSEIKRNTDDQPLGETIVQLVMYFSQKTAKTQELDKPTEVGAPIEDTETRTILKEIVVELDRSSEETGEAKLTPEITRMLLTFIEILGYENPEETLFEFVSQNGIKALLLSIKQLQSLSDDTYKEFYTGTLRPTINVSTDYITVSYIGRVLLELITPLVYQKV